MGNTFTTTLAAGVFRITAQDVIDLLEFDPGITNFDPFIMAAEELVTELCVPVGYDNNRLKVIEAWLAAHFVAIKDGGFFKTSESIGAASESHSRSQLSANLALTFYGQQAMVLDTKGGLAYIDKHVAQGRRTKVGIVHLGTPPREAVVQRYPTRWLEFLP